MTLHQRAWAARGAEQAAARAQHAARVTAADADVQGTRPRAHSDDVCGLLRPAAREARYARLGADQGAWWAAHMPDVDAYRGTAWAPTQNKTSDATPDAAEAALRSAVAAAQSADGVCDVAALRRAVWGARGRLAPEDRGLGNGIFQSGTAIGSLVAPLVIGPIAASRGWRTRCGRSRRPPVPTWH